MTKKKHRSGGRLFQKGQSGNPAGRKKGSCNKVTLHGRAAFAALLAANLANMQAWLDRVARRSPLQALRCVFKMAEFVVPKPHAVEVTGKDGEAIEVRHESATPEALGRFVEAAAKAVAANRNASELRSDGSRQPMDSKEATSASGRVSDAGNK